MPVKRLSRLNPNVPPWLEAVVHRCIAMKPERRYQHYSELTHDLKNPAKVQPFYDAAGPLLEHNPLAFYKVGFFIFFIMTVWLALKLLNQ